MSEVPLRVEEVDPEDNANFKEKFAGHPSGVIRIQPGNFIFNTPFKHDYEKIYNMEVKPDDIWVLTFPKAGTSWTQEIVWTISHGGDIEASMSKEVFQKWMFVEFDAMLADVMDKKMAGVPQEERIKNSFLYKTIHAESPRHIKSHLPLHMLPPKLLDTCKVIYVARNPMDVCVSWYHHSKGFNNHSYQGTFEDFFGSFVKDKLLYSPYWDNVKQAWEKRKHPNMLFLFYEDMKKDISGNLHNIANFLGKSLTEKQFEAIENHVEFSSMKKNPKLNMETLKDLGALRKDAEFIRKGIVGDWKNHFTSSMEKEMADWCKKNAQDLDIKFPGVELW